ncbi:Aspartyl/glutamyl-tRNA(Asn/Gln) amidotransferase subunit B [Desulfovibrionales bacterium]
MFLFMPHYEIIIGLEVHAQLLTESKLFCACSTRFGVEPNENVCEVCSGMPGALPVLNRRAVEYACRVAMATDCIINNDLVFARKNYFYPDLPKGYQISQYETPLAEHGYVDIDVFCTTGISTKRIGITRIHIEDDAGKSVHSATENRSFIDLNRSGIPLVEIVSEPDLRSPEEAVSYLKALHVIFIYLGICDGNMEEGSFRCDVNISLRPQGQKELGTRTELKNVNSFRFVKKALEYEIARQRSCLEDGKVVVQETRLYDSLHNVTVSMRGKEEAHDYRYFPDPDLLPVCLDSTDLDIWRANIPELPRARKLRFMKDFGLSTYDADLLTVERDLADYFEAAVCIGKASEQTAKKYSNWIMSELVHELAQVDLPVSRSPFSPAALASLISCIENGIISGKIGKEIFPEIFQQGVEDVEAFVKAKGLTQISDINILGATVDAALENNPKKVVEYKSGKIKVLDFFVGQVMKATKGQANPALVNTMLRVRLNK